MLEIAGLCARLAVLPPPLTKIDATCDTPASQPAPMLRRIGRSGGGAVTAVEPDFMPRV
jgi:hypothetical protein